jgi:Porin subfamily
LFGSATAVRFKSTVGDLTTAKGISANYVTGTAVSADFTCNPDFNTYQLGVITRWAPVKNLTFSADVMWFRLDQETTGAATLTPAAPKPSATYEYRDQEAVSLLVRAQRNF